MSDELNQEEQENHIVEMETRYASSLEKGEVTEEMNEDGPLVRQLYRRRCERNFDVDSERDNSVPAPIKKILKNAVLMNFDKLADTSECPGATKKQYKEARIFFQNHLEPTALKEQFPDMAETPERECERIMSLFTGEFQGMPHTKNTMLKR